MMLTTYLACDLSKSSQSESSVAQSALNPPTDNSNKKEDLRHILLGSSGAIRQTIYLLHSLGYSESGLWTPLSPVSRQIVITSEQGEMMSLLRRSL